MSIINTLPKGLQEFLGNTSQGKNPSQLSNIVAPMVDMEPFWSADKLRNEVANAPVGAFGSGVEISVPEGEVWIPIACSTDTFAAVGETYALNLHLTDAAGNARSQLANVSETAAVSTRQVGCSIVFPRTICIPAGWVFRGQVDEFGGGTPTISIDITYVLLKA